MPIRDIIVLGGSAGGIEASCEVLRGLPGDLGAACFIVQHVGEASVLDQVLSRCSGLPVKTPKDRELIKSGQAYVAPGGRHLALNDGHMQLVMSPRENRHRPSVDVLFRSAARAYRSRVIAVILSGTLDDGASGVVAVKERGGTVIVQDPADAAFSGMPENAMRTGRVDYSVPARKIPELLVKLTQGDGPMTKQKNSHRNREQKRVGRPTGRKMAAAPFTCPDCSGPLFSDPNGNAGQLKCIVGHSFAPESLSEAHKEALERSLLITMRLLQERAEVEKNVARTAGHSARWKLRGHFQEGAEATAKDVALLQEILNRI